MLPDRIRQPILRWIQNDRIAWPAQLKLRDSFLSKALTSFSLATFALGNIAPLLEKLGVDFWRLRCLFIGSVLFLLGYLVLTFRVPPEFRGGTSLNDIVRNMLTIQDRSFFESRRAMTISILQRLNVSRPFDLSDGVIQYARTHASPTTQITDDNWTQYAASLYHADIVLRQYDRPRTRLISLGLMAAGIVFLLVPTLDGVIRAVAGQLP
jgi:hypothetical protein